ncbi:Phox homologous domain-containing protein [Cunninghamella echinulata]|nr:Phox homologous domain-containing protein [Cunninghamella echinulata]
MNSQRQLMDTLDQCQQVSVKIQSSDDITLKKDIRDSIKSLVKLQDEYDDAFNKEEIDTWEQQVQQAINQVQKKIQPFSNGTTIETPFVKALQNKKMENTATGLKDSFNNEKVIPQPTTTITPTTKKTLYQNQIVLLFDEFPEIQNETERRSRLTIPLFKNLGISQSSPVPGAPVQINFYNDSDATENKLFATDAIVSHPLRIGVGYGSYICYSCTVFSNKGTPITVRKRYSDFVEIRQRLVKQYPHLKSSIPKLPPKKVVGKFTPTFVEQRRRDLEYFFKYIFLHPTLGSSTVVKQWITPVSV